MYSRKICFLFLLTLSIASCQITMAEEPDRAERESEEITSVLLDPLLDFTSKLFKTVRKDKSNVIVSPVSIHSAFNLVLLGAEPNSNTEKEMLKTLGYGSSSSRAKSAHESYAKLMALMKKVSDIGIKRRSEGKELQTVKGRGLGDYSLPVLDIWNLLVSKNMTPLPEYVDKATKYYNCTVTKNTGDAKENQALVDSVNSWAKQSGFEQDLLKMSDLTDGKPESILIMNAVRVQGWWFEEFNEYKDEEVFYNHGLRANLVKNAPALGKSDILGRYIEFTDPSKSYDPKRASNIRSGDAKTFDELAKLNFRILDIPLTGDLTFTILEPLANGTGNELKKLEDQLLDGESETLLAKALRRIDSSSAGVTFDHLQIPPFRFNTDLELVEPLKSMGMKQAFDSLAGQINKLATKDSYVDEAKHKAVIEVNKSGLKASAMTVVTIVPLSAIFRKFPLRVAVNNPFVFLVRYNKLPMFVGHLVEI